MFPLISLLLTAPAHADSISSAFNSTIARVESMVWDQSVQQMVSRHGLTAVNVTWEDTGRYKGSVYGPNISDMTIGVRDPSGALHPMPVVRFDNYTDTTGDIDPSKFWLRVGNEDGRALKNISLSQLLKSPRAYMHNPSSWSGTRTSLWAARDSQVIVSAQACFLPIPRSGQAEFTPVIYNYNSSPGNPAVLTIVATREGTSMQVVENKGGYLSEVLYFNEDGERAPFVAERLSDFKAHGGDATTPGWAANEDSGADVVLVIQVPLKQREVANQYWGYGSDEGIADMPMAAPPASASGASKAFREEQRSDVEVAVVGHGDTEGYYDEFGHLAIERDTRYPVRVTVQFYKATSNGVVSEADIADIRAQIDRVYANADWVGSLVTDGYTGRVTEWVAPQPPPQRQPAETATWAEPTWSWMKPW